MACIHDQNVALLTALFLDKIRHFPKSQVAVVSVHIE